MMAIAGLTSDGYEGESFTTLTTEPGPPYHDRQIVILQPREWAEWIYLTKLDSDFRPSPAGSHVGRQNN